jgi:hypothetical protein
MYHVRTERRATQGAESDADSSSLGEEEKGVSP